MDHRPRFVNWNSNRSYLPNFSCHLPLLRLWACGQRLSLVQAQRHVHSLVAQFTGQAVAPPQSCSHCRPPMTGDDKNRSSRVCHYCATDCSTIIRKGIGIVGNLPIFSKGSRRPGAGRTRFRLPQTGAETAGRDVPNRQRPITATARLPQREGSPFVAERGQTGVA